MNYFIDDSLNQTQVIIIGGTSGSGKSTALKALQDLGYFCIDNLPCFLFPYFFSIVLKDQEGESPYQHTNRFALLLDFRDEGFIREITEITEQVRGLGGKAWIFYLDAQNEILLRRFKETRRPHPLQILSPELSLENSIEQEKEFLMGFKNIATQLLDTSKFTPHELRRVVGNLIGEEKVLEIEVYSFGYSRGVPSFLDLVFDVRFIDNPHYMPELKPKTGLDPKVSEFVLQSEKGRNFIFHLRTMLEYLLPEYIDEGRRYLSIGIGCTGGRHRSVAIAECIVRELSQLGNRATAIHRDIL